MMVGGGRGGVTVPRFGLRSDWLQSLLHVHCMTECGGRDDGKYGICNVKK